MFPARSAVVAIVAFFSSGSFACSGGDAGAGTDADVTADAADPADTRSDDSSEAGSKDVGPPASEGEPCPDYRCAQGLQCQSHPACKAGLDCPRVCARLVTSCAGDSCGPNAYCVGIWDKSGGSCAARGAIGSPCTMAPLADHDVNTCVDGAFCKVSGTRGVCAADHAAGSDCSEPFWAGADRFACAGGDTCVRTTLGGPAKCVPARKASEPCLDNGACDHGLYCATSDSKCTMRLAVGERCVQVAVNDEVCVAGSQCFSGVCIP